MVAGESPRPRVNNASPAITSAPDSPGLQWPIGMNARFMQLDGMVAAATHILSAPLKPKCGTTVAMVPEGRGLP